ncbi:MAG: DUF1653 domain-containing protein [Lachnospiraceae bacterium]|nr:DUF1653 domain-containing protein [Lachnospiraceae bacterium]
MREVRAGQFYRHFKGGTYQTLAVAEHTETGERLVIYQALYGDYRVYARPYDMFVGEVDRGKYPQAGQIYRFEEIEPQSSASERKEGQAPTACEEKQTERQDGVNPILLEFLDADTLEEKTHILIRYRNQMDESLLNSIAIALDVVVEKKGIQEKYDEILNCLSMMKRFETTRLR